MSFATVSSKGQITLPAEIRSRFGIRSKDKVRLYVRDEEIVIQPLRPFRDLRGSVKPQVGDSRKSMEELAARHAMETES